MHGMTSLHLYTSVPAHWALAVALQGSGPLCLFSCCSYAGGSLFLLQAGMPWALSEAPNPR